MILCLAAAALAVRPMPSHAVRLAALRSARPAAVRTKQAVGRQDATPTAKGQTPPDTAGPGDRAGRPDGPAAPSRASITFDEAEIHGTRIRATNVSFVSGEYAVTGGLVDGDTEDVLVFTGSPVLTYRSQVMTGESIRFRPRERAYLVQRLHAALTPDFLQGRVASPLFLSAGGLTGRQGEPASGSDAVVTGCEREEPHYLVRAGSIEVDPGRRIVLKRAGIVLWGRRLVTLPSLLIPLDRSAPERGYTPQVGRSADEGWFVKSAFNYAAGETGRGVYHVDAMQLKGLGLGIDQTWQSRRSAGMTSIYGIPAGGVSKDLSGRIDLRQNLGAGQNLTVNADLRKNSYLTMPGNTSLGARLGYSSMSAGGDTAISLNRQTNESANYSTESLGSSLSRSWRFGRSGSLSVAADYSRSATSGGSYQQVQESLTTRMQAESRGTNYNLQLVANKAVPMGGGTGQQYYGGVQKLPEMALTSYRFTEGWAARLPATFNLTAGRYTESGTLGRTAITTERVVGGFDLTGARWSLARGTGLDLSGGFQQYAYSDGSAQYLVRSSVGLQQQLGGRSRFSLSHTYSRPEGGTPLRFDQQGQYHSVNADLRLVGGGRLEFGVRSGYDFTRGSYAGIQQPWQTLSANALYKPAQGSRVRAMMTYDPNQGEWISSTADLRLAGSGDSSFSLLARYDPRRHRMANANSHIVMPLGRVWRITALAQYNGYLSRFESKALQVTRDLHCMEVVFTYMENPFGYRAQRQITFQLRIKALPILNQFGSGAFGQSLDTSTGEIY